MINDNWITSAEELSRLPRRQGMTIRYRGATEGRCTTTAQDAPDIISMLEGSDRYVRDILLNNPIL